MELSISFINFQIKGFIFNKGIKLASNKTACKKCWKLQHGLSTWSVLLAQNKEMESNEVDP